jgi:hypothetical protein
MFINYLLNLRKRRTPSNIEPRGGAIKTGFRPVSAGFDSVLRSGMTLIAAERIAPDRYGPECDRARLEAIIRRRDALTGGRPRHAVRARRSDDLAREAEAANAP